MSDTLEIAVGGTIPRDDLCCQCQSPMLYRTDGENRVIESFCANSRCPAFLIEIAEERADA